MVGEGRGEYPPNSEHCKANNLFFVWSIELDGPDCLLQIISFIEFMIRSAKSSTFHKIATASKDGDTEATQLAVACNHKVEAQVRVCFIHTYQ